MLHKQIEIDKIAKSVLCIEYCIVRQYIFSTFHMSLYFPEFNEQIYVEMLQYTFLHMAQGYLIARLLTFYATLVIAGSKMNNLSTQERECG